MSRQCQPQELLICFVDIRRWLRGTAEKRPDEVFAFLTDMYEKVLPLAEDHGGRLVKVMGDAALIVWDPADAARAIGAARAMRAKLAELQQDFGPAEPMSLGVAMSLGAVIAGEMGPPSIRRFDVIGDPVNAAALMLRGHDFAITSQVADAAQATDLAGIEIA